MKLRKLPLSIACACLAGAISLVGCSSTEVKQQPSQQQAQSATLVEQSTGAIPYTKYELANGLTVILHEDSSDPLVNVNVTYHVGSAREEFGKSGFAHFFEHMMFQGSENVADEEHFKIVTESGGTMNGSTNSDITNYYQTVPVNQLEKILWLEADRMGFLLDAVTQEKFENQRETVKNERGQRVDNQPYGLRFERMGEAMYPVGHPYSWSTIGYIEDLNRVGLDDLKAFFQRWYGPNNAVITIGGSIDKAQTLAWVQKYFGSIPRGPEVNKADKAPAKLAQTRHITLEDKVHLPLLQINMPTVYAHHEDEPALDVLADILGNGKTSLFYKNMVKEGLAVQAFVGHPCRELACEFTLLALANPQKVNDLKQLKTIVDDTLREFETRGVTDEDLQRTKAAIESNTVFGLQSVAGKVFSLTSGEIFHDQPDMVSTNIERYNAVTKEDVMRVYNQYIKGKPAVVMSIVPEGKTELAVQEADFTTPERDLSLVSTQQAEVKTVNIQDDFDRSVQPKAGLNPLVSIPEFWQFDFANGIELLGVNTDETPTVTLQLAIKGGALLDPLDKPGLASLTAGMMNESTLESSNEELANRLALLGSSVSFAASGQYTNIYLSSLTKNLGETLAILEEKLFEPGFKAEDFERLKQRTIQGLQQSLKNPSVLASRAVDLVLYGDDTRVGLPDNGTLASIESITLEDVKAFYNNYYRPNQVSSVIVGDVAESEAKQALAFLTSWQAQDYSIPSFADAQKPTTGKVYLVDKPDSVQSVISIVKHGPVYDADGEYFKNSLMNFPLGGMFNSRINLNLREDKGFTYGARSGFRANQELGRFSAGADVAGQHTVASIQEFLYEIERYQSTGMTDEELRMMQKAVTQRDALKYETPSAKANFLINLLTLDLDPNYRERQTAIINTVSKESLNALANKWLESADMDIIVVGDAKVLREELKALDREIVELTVPM